METDKLMILFHELFHCCERWLALTIKEEVIDTLATFMVAVLKDNPQLLEEFRSQGGIDEKDKNGA